MVEYKTFVDFFLAAMSSTRSDIVTQCVRLFVCVSMCVSLCLLFVYLKFLLVLKSFNGVSRQFKGCLKFSGSFKDVSRKFQGCFKQISRVFKGSLKGVSR